MEPTDPTQPMIVMPVEAATATAPDGRRLVFFTVPQMGALIEEVHVARPATYTYQWGYHPTEKMHVLLFRWPGGPSGGVAIPEGAGDQILLFMTGTTDVFLTVMPVQGRLQGTVATGVVEEIINGPTVSLPHVKFSGSA
jgi:hypothetical protein